MNLFSGGLLFISFPIYPHVDRSAAPAAPGSAAGQNRVKQKFARLMLTEA